MSAAEVIGIGLLGGVGAIARFMLDGSIGERLQGPFPYGTLAVNLLGSFILGALVGAAVRGTSEELLGTGLIGSFTTFSTWVFESHRLGEDGQLGMGVANLLVSLVLGVGTAWAGRQLGGVL
jgi:CrcB protein